MIPGDISISAGEASDRGTQGVSGTRRRRDNRTQSAREDDDEVTVRGRDVNSCWAGKFTPIDTGAFLVF